MQLHVGIKTKLFLTILAAVLCVVVGMHLLMQWSFSRGFLSYVHSLEMNRLEMLVPVLEELYASDGDWRSLEHDRRAWHRLLHETLRDGAAHRPERAERKGELQPRNRPSSPPRAVVQFERRLILLDAQKKPVHAPQSLPDGLDLILIQQDHKVVGYLGLLPRKTPEDNQQLTFFQKQRRAFSLISLLMAGIATLLALPLAHHLVKRIRTLASATRSLADGDYAIELPATSKDELGQLANDFNHLALSLEKNQQQRRQWVADISHELRTPLAILRGEIEALQDGVRSVTPETLSSLHNEVQRLTRLVEDLYQLALSDVGALDYQLSLVDFGPLLASCLSTFRTQMLEKGLLVEVNCPESQEFPLHADPQRITQLLDNLIGNTLKYTDAPGRVEINVSRTDTEVIFNLHDSAPGVANGDLDNLFKRLFRVEASRNRASGGAGLGLSICRNIVEGHRGSISAQPSPLGGLWIQVKLPLAEISR